MSLGGRWMFSEFRLGPALPAYVQWKVRFLPPPPLLPNSHLLGS